VYDWTGMLREIISNRQSGKMGGDTYVLTLANGGLRMAYNPSFKLAADIRAKADAAVEGIKSGSIKPMP
jgi:basic membrane protein A